MKGRKTAQWEPWEDAVIRRASKFGLGMEYVLDRLRSRTKGAVRVRVAELNKRSVLMTLSIKTKSYCPLDVADLCWLALYLSMGGSSVDYADMRGIGRHRIRDAIRRKLVPTPIGFFKVRNQFGFHHSKMHRLCADSGVYPRQSEKGSSLTFFPEDVDELFGYYEANRRFYEGDYWSPYIDECISCESTKSRHNAYGLCRTCYSRFYKRDELGPWIEKFEILKEVAVQNGRGKNRKRIKRNRMSGDECTYGEP